MDNAHRAGRAASLLSSSASSSSGIQVCTSNRLQVPDSKSKPKASSASVTTGASASCELSSLGEATGHSFGVDSQSHSVGLSIWEIKGVDGGQTNEEHDYDEARPLVLDNVDEDIQAALDLVRPPSDEEYEELQDDLMATVTYDELEDVGPWLSTDSNYPPTHKDPPIIRQCLSEDSLASSFARLDGMSEPSSEPSSDRDGEPARPTNAASSGPPTVRPRALTLDGFLAAPPPGVPSGRGFRGPRPGEPRMIQRAVTTGCASSSTEPAADAPAAARFVTIQRPLHRRRPSAAATAAAEADASARALVEAGAAAAAEAEASAGGIVQARAAAAAEAEAPEIPEPRPTLRQQPAHVQGPTSEIADDRLALVVLAPKPGPQLPPTQRPSSATSDVRLSPAVTPPKLQPQPTSTPASPPRPQPQPPSTEVPTSEVVDDGKALVGAAGRALMRSELRRSK